MWHSISCLFVTELLRLPFACYSFQLFAGDYFSIIIILQRMYAIYKQTHPPTGIEHCEYCQLFFTSWKTIVLWQEHHSFVSASFIPKARWETGSVNRLMGTSVVVLLKISRSISWNDAQWWNLPKRPGVRAEGLVDFFSQTGGIWHSVSCLFVTELLRLPFACYSFQLFAVDYFSIIIILQLLYYWKCLARYQV